jgi:hypothetical protein
MWHICYSSEPKNAAMGMNVGNKVDDCWLVFESFAELTK